MSRYEDWYTSDARRPGPTSVLSTDPGLTIHNSADIERILAKPQWKAHLRTVYIGWSKIYASERFETAIDIVSRFDKLRHLHVFLPDSKSFFYFDTSKVTSVTTPVSIDELGNTPPDLEALLAIFRCPSLRRLCIDSMRRMDHDIPEEYHIPGISNVTSLFFIHCGLPSRKIQPLLAWPKDLRKLVIDCSVPRLSMRESSEGEYEDHSELLDALAPLSGSLHSLYCTLIDDRTWERADGTAFHEFHALKRLTIDIEVLMDNPLEISAPPIHTRLPPSLEELKLYLFEDLISQAFIPAKQIESNPGMSIPKAEEVLDWLSGMIRHRDEHFPNLRRVVLTHVHWDFDLPCSQNQACLLYYDFTAKAVRLFVEAGIALVFYDNVDRIGRR